MGLFLFICINVYFMNAESIVLIRMYRRFKKMSMALCQERGFTFFSIYLLKYIIMKYIVLRKWTPDFNSMFTETA